MVRSERYGANIARRAPKSASGTNSASKNAKLWGIEKEKYFSGNISEKISPKR
ncbi:MAG: hypothetical protein PT951_03410 [Eubacteriales bacterium]|nr:hypothetical protein [Eubacteriales bacterium]MDY2827575.1 hypothetical protein [Eubacteriales bacterium]